MMYDKNGHDGNKKMKTDKTYGGMMMIMMMECVESDDEESWMSYLPI
jgi:hypothetical protein